MNQELQNYLDEVAQEFHGPFLFYRFLILHKSNNLYICVRIPNNIEVAKLLDDKLIKLRESIVNQYPKYSFTGFERKGVYLISVGTK